MRKKNKWNLKVMTTTKKKRKGTWITLTRGKMMRILMKKMSKWKIMMKIIRIRVIATKEIHLMKTDLTTAMITRELKLELVLKEEHNSKEFSRDRFPRIHLQTPK